MMMKMIPNLPDQTRYMGVFEVADYEYRDIIGYLVPQRIFPPSFRNIRVQRLLARIWAVIYLKKN